ncbi:hypothetical protein C8B47_10805 [filamentous cyanobacterium CCP4]|nr:hypothetical protein C8B47_10805 [filamentous cyanobacterium CCP4]
MAEWVGDNIYIQFEGGNLASAVEIQGEYKKVKLTGGVSAIETTRGPNKKHKMNVPGMHEYPMEITVGIDDSDIYPDYLELDQIYTVTFAPNGNTVGQPLHVQEYFLEEVPIEYEMGRGERVYAIKLKQHDAPTVNIFEQGVVAA